ncbi:hypothetical protein D3C74_440010 [compost metagenome]
MPCVVDIFPFQIIRALQLDTVRAFALQLLECVLKQIVTGNDVSVQAFRGRYALGYVKAMCAALVGLYDSGNHRIKVFV